MPSRLREVMFKVMAGRSVPIRQEPECVMVYETDNLMRWAWAESIRAGESRLPTREAEYMSATDKPPDRRTQPMQCGADHI